MSGLTVRLVSKAEAPRFACFVQHEPYRSIMADNKPFKGVLLAVGLFDGDQPLALLLGHILEGRSYCLLAGIGADIAIKGSGIEKQMEAYLAQKCLSLQIRQLRFFYDSDSSGAPEINALLDEAGYEPAKAELLVCRCDKRLSDLALMDYTELPPGLDTVNWLEVPETDRARFAALLATCAWHDPVLSPFTDDAHIRPEPSLALVKGPELVGWAVCHQTQADTIDYTTIGVFPEYQGVGTGIALQMRSIQRHLRSSLADQIPYGRFVVQYKDQARMRVLKKKFVPHAVDWHDRMLRVRNF